MYLTVRWIAHENDKGATTSSELIWKESVDRPVLTKKPYQWLFERENGRPVRELKID